MSSSAMEHLDATDKLILNRIQSDFPITKNPFKTIAAELDLTETDVLERVDRLKSTGIIRRIGGNFVPEKVGFVSTLCAAKVPQDKLGRFAETVNAYPASPTTTCGKMISMSGLRLSLLQGK